MSNKEEITAIVERVQDGERELMPELWNAVERLVAWQANRIILILPASAGVDFDDLYNSGYIALNDAVQRYERDTGEFISLFMLRLKTAFSEASGAISKRAQKDPLRQACTESLDTPIPGTEDITLSDSIADERDAYAGAEERIFNEQLHDELERALSSIAADEAEVIRLRFYEGCTLEQAADRRNNTTADIRRFEGKGLRDLRSPRISRPLRQFLEDSTPFFLHVGPQKFNTTQTSSVEQIALMREKMEERALSASNGGSNSPTFTNIGLRTQK